MSVERERSYGPPPEPEAYGWNPPNSVEGEHEVPMDLVQHYREFRPGYWGYVCPSCHNVYAPGWGPSIPADFRAHIKPWTESKGCFFSPQAAAGGGR
jgi:hypothetical protein